MICKQPETFDQVNIGGRVIFLKKPVIETRSGATPEIIKEGFNGLLYEPGNHQQLAEKIKYLIEHSQKAKKLGENGFKEASRKYTIKKHAGEIFGILQGAVKSKQKREVH